MNKYYKKIKDKLILKKNYLKKNNKVFDMLFINTSISFSIKKQTFFAKRLSFLIKAGIPILESIHIIKDQSKNKREKKVFKQVIKDISNGQSLSKALSRFKKTFGNFVINVIKAGENSGSLSVNLNYLADELNKKEILRRKIIGAMLYPIIITIATFGITIFLTLYIFPKIVPLFQSLNTKLPLSTQIIIKIVEIFKEKGLYIILIVFIIGFILSLLIKFIPKVNIIFNKILLKIPIFGSMIKNYNLTNTLRTLGLLLKSGISLNESLIITAETSDNILYKNAFREISSQVIKGKPVSNLIGQYPEIFPIMLSCMISIGEKSGNLSKTLIYLSEFYENEFENQTKNLSSTIEPFLMIIMGLMVGFIAVSVITPIYEITNSIHK